MKAAGVSSREKNDFFVVVNVCKVNISAGGSGREADRGDAKVGVCGGDIRLGPALVQRGILFPYASFGSIATIIST